MTLSVYAFASVSVEASVKCEECARALDCLSIFGRCVLVCLFEFVLCDVNMPDIVRRHKEVVSILLRLFLCIVVGYLLRL